MRRARYIGSSRPGARRALPGAVAAVAAVSLLVVGFVAPAGAETVPPTAPGQVTDPAPEESPGWTETPSAPETPTDATAPTAPTAPTGPAAPTDPATPPGTPPPGGGEVLGPAVPEPGPAPAPEATAAEADAPTDPGVTPFLVPPATGNNAVITVKVGSDRTSLVAVGPLAGVTLQLYDGVNAPTTPVADAWATCVSDADGDCSFVVPDTQLNASNYDRRFWVVQSGAPTGWYTNPDLGTGSSGSTITPYEFRTGTLLRAGSTYTSQGSFMLATGNTNATASGGIWQSSRDNPTFPAQCGIDVALVLDLSGSVAPDLPELKAAANQFVASLTGTPSNMGLFTFSSLAPAANNPNLALTPVSTPESAQVVTDRINSYTAVGGTNWDRGIYQVATDPQTYDVAVVITDGNPTFYGNQEGPGNFTRLRETENGVFSANAVKAQGTHMVAFGVGDGIDSVGSGLNLRAISGELAGTDYFQTTDYEEAGDQLRELALGSCAGSVSVVKQVVPPSAPPGSIEGAQPAGGWELTSESQSAGVTVNAPTTTTTAVGTGAANFDLTFAGGTTSGTVGVMETQQSGFTLQQVGGANAVCTNLATGADVTVTNSGDTGFLVPVSTTAAVSCTIYNRAPSPVASLVLNKTWVVNGQTYPDGQQPAALTAAASVAGTPQPWTVPRTGLQEGQSVAIAETTTNGLQGCTITSQRVTAVNGATVDVGLPSSVTLVAGPNSAVITNVVTCTSTLTLAKEVQGGPAAPTGWTLDAVAPGGALPGPNGVVGSSGATALVTPGIVYPLAESGGDPNYAQATGPNAVLVPGSSGSWLCVELAADGTTVIPGFSDGLNGGVNVPLGRWIRCTAVNQAATVNVQKFVENRFGGTAVPSDWSLTVTPLGTVPPGVVAQTVTGSNTATPITVRPGVTYTVSESGLPEGYVQTAAACTIVEQPRGLTFTLQRLDTASCSFTNADTPGPFTAVKTSDPGSGATVLPGDVITYTVTVSPTGERFGADVVVTDDLAAVLNNATLVEGSIVTSTGSAGLTGTTLTWDVGELVDTETVTYQVRVADGAYGVTLTNVVTVPGAEPCVEPEPPAPADQGDTVRVLASSLDLAAAATDGAVEAAAAVEPVATDGTAAAALAVVDPAEACRTTSHVTPAWTLTKSSDPASGTQVSPGSTITYTLTATSTTDALVSGAVVTDDLSKVLAYGALVAPPEGATISGSTLTWEVPDLTTAGATATLTYQVRLASNARGVTVTNLATPGPGGGCVVCTTTHEVPPVVGPPATGGPTTGGLAFTGAGVAGFVAGAGFLVLLGTLLVRVRRRARE
ncbi:VWA domain-containing protein [Oerskovia sp. NPDC057915]|uniref:DUF7927 domain-containing protein n=1 Tax=Oerskovia sp. NPDC057915 TaxID=3346280 RepID=UPI0036DE617F